MNQLSTILSLAGLFLCGSLSQAQPTASVPGFHQVWQKQYDGPPVDARDWPHMAIWDGQDGVFVLGSVFESWDLVLLKYSTTQGTLAWSWRSPEHEPQIDVRSAAVDAQGAIFVTGPLGESARGEGYHLAKHSGQDGARLWAFARVDGLELNDEPAALAVDRNGDVVVAGFHRLNPGYDEFSAKFRGTDGSLVWRQRYDSPEHADDLARAVAVDAAGNALAAGAVGLECRIVLRAAGDGSVLWEKRLQIGEGAHTEGKSVVFDPAGNPIVGGSFWHEDHYDMFIAKYSAADGARLWLQTVHTSGETYGQTPALAVDAAGDLAVGGGTGASLVVARYRGSDGGLIWTQEEPGRASLANGVNFVSVDAVGNVTAIGALESVDYVAKYAAADGARLWEHKKLHPVAYVGGATEGNGDIYTLGGFTNPQVPGSTIDLVLGKRAGTDGSLAWERGFNSSTRGSDSAEAMVLDSQGNFIVAGRSGNDAITLKYSGRDGALLWAHRYDGPARLVDRATAVATDAAGDILVCGSVGTLEDDLQSVDIRTAKYSGASGLLLWERFYDSPGFQWGQRDAPFAMAPDAQGNVVILGYSKFDGVWQGLYLAKYAGQTGAILWERTNQEPGRGELSPVSLELDAAGNPLVVWSREDFGVAGRPTETFLTQYSGAAGAPMWQERLQTMFPAPLQVSRLVLDHAGNLLFFGMDGANLHLAKRRASDRSPLWARSYPLPRSYGNIYRIEVDPSGAIYAIGDASDSRNNIRQAQGYAAKFSADGARLWEQVFPPIENVVWVPDAMQPDPSGGLVLLLIEVNGAARVRTRLVRLAPEDGSIRLENVLADYARLLAVDPFGAVGVMSFHDGDILASLFAPESSPRLHATSTASGVRLAWPAYFMGWRLEQFQSVLGLDSGSAWKPVPGSTGSNAAEMPLDGATAPMFFRLAKP